jgi:tRNA threonylcarbamoyladenosine biosynthesis protein TsaB
MLAFDTATPAVAVAVHDGRAVLAEATAVDARRQGEILAATIASLLARVGLQPADLSVIAVGVGPGPYTSLRAGLATAHALGGALDIGVHGVCTLDVMARAAAPACGGDFLVATDARRREVYWARYGPGGERTEGPGVSAPASLPAALPTAGEGPCLYPGTLGPAIEPRYPSAGMLAAMAAEAIVRRVPLLPPSPLYLRRPDARVPGPVKRVTPAPTAEPVAGRE